MHVTKVLAKSFWCAQKSQLNGNHLCVVWFESPFSPLSDDVLRGLVMAAVVKKQVAFREQMYILLGWMPKSDMIKHFWD